MGEQAKRGVLELNVGGSFKYLHITMDIIPVISSMCEVNDNLFSPGMTDRHHNKVLRS